MQEVIIKKLVLTHLVADRLNRLKNPPVNLYYLGADPHELLKHPVVAIVGTRKMSPYGRIVCEKLTTELVRAGVTIISGNALGVDVTAQKIALDQGGRVIAVVASGLDSVYPATNRAVANRIVEQGGSIISEFERDHSTPRPDEFLARNRIIAALSDAVMIPEAAERSGSLNTAKHAAVMKIPIFAVPGPITSNLSSGTNKLIKDGNHIVTSAQDILELLNITPVGSQTNLLGCNDTETLILQILSDETCDTTILQHKTMAPLSDLQTALTMLEIDARIKQNSLGNWQLT
jgi:DNA processing protein